MRINVNYTILHQYIDFITSNYAPRNRAPN